MEIKERAKIAALNLHVAQYVRGQAPVNLSAKRHDVTFDEHAIGVDVLSKGKLIKMIPYTNIQSVDYEE